MPKLIPVLKFCVASCSCGATLDVAAIRGWIAAQDVDEVWFCGAGTNAYIGDIIAAALKGTRSVTSVDLVADPDHVLKGARPLVVSFGRSGNSAESIALMDALDAIATDAPRLNITCNKDGALATRPITGPSQVIVLPVATHDAGFAMTSSFSKMLLAALALFDAPYDFAARLNILADQMERLLPAFPRPSREYDFDLAAELGAQFPASNIQTIGSGDDIDIAMPSGAAWAAPDCVAVAQVRGVERAHQIGLTVRDPFASQAILSRAASDVKLYPVTP